MRRRLLADLDAAVVSFEGRVEGALRAAARSWVQLLGDRTERRMRELAERFRNNLRTPPRDEDLAVLDELSDRLTGFRADLQGSSSGAGDHPTLTGPVDPPDVERITGHADACVVCRQMEATLFEYLRHEQLALATHEHKQTQHARTGGFCPLHTWDYGRLASPVGISAGYAKLTESTADLLDAVGRRSSTVHDLAHGVTALAARAEGCPICAALLVSERNAIAEVTADMPAGARVPTLCLQHLALALASGPALDHGKAMLGSLAAALRRDSEDMRTFALKEEAFHSGKATGLVTDEESHAHHEALRLLAGRRALVSAQGQG